MPHHDKEENTTGSMSPHAMSFVIRADLSTDITDQVAKESSDSNASDHPIHQVENTATSGGKATAQDHSANPVSDAVTTWPFNHD